MKQVAAYEDSAGRLHKTAREAIEADFTAMVREAWGQMPAEISKGDPAKIAQALASVAYESSRVQLRKAIAWFDEQLSAQQQTRPEITSGDSEQAKRPA